MKEYNFTEIEQKWQNKWRAERIYQVTTNPDKPKCYVLDMFPYPSGAGLHVGHPLGYIASDIYARYKRLKGYNVLHPMGYDSFGLPAEQYAIQTGQHPAVTTENNINRYREQLDKIGFSYDWEREVRTSDPDYYKWTQWIFIQLYNSWYNPSTDKAEPIETLVTQLSTHGFTGVDDTILTGGIELDFASFTGEEWKSFSIEKQEEILLGFRLAYISEAYVNWCPQLGTVLSNDEVKDGVSERGGYPVERKLMNQWSMRITAYADRLLKDLDGLDWSDSLKEAQRNWIGKSQGASVNFKVQDSNFDIEVFTTRPDTIFGVSFIAVAPEYEFLNDLIHPDQMEEVQEYVEVAKNRSERERMADVKRVTGAFTGMYAIHPFTGSEVPIWVADYVLAGYGTGAVMGVTAHDSRDFAFAKQFDLPIKPVVKIPEGHDLNMASYDAKEGQLTNSDFLNGLEVKEAIKKAIEYIEKGGHGKGKTNFRLRDAIFGRQRYWGEPIPVYYKNGLPKCVPAEKLPLVLPEVDKFLPTEDGEPPLARAEKWMWDEEKGEVSTTGYPLETTTMPGWAGSSWYFLRYMDPKNDKELVSKEAVEYWKNVDLYLGGSEHATGHLLYVRFWTKFLFDRGFIPVNEPAQKLINQGMIQGMSPKAYITKTASDTFVQAKYILHLGLQSIYLDRPYRFVFSKDTFKSTDEFEIDYMKRLNLIGFNVDFIDKEGCFDMLNAFNNQFERSLIEDAIFICENGLVLNGKFIEKNDLLKYALGDNPLKSEDEKYHFISLASSDFEFSNPTTKPLFRCLYEVEKMSKSKRNVVTPDNIVASYGADTLRLYEMFLGPLEQSKPWNTNGITGVSGFLKKLWRLFYDANGTALWTEGEADKKELKALHKLIKKVADDVEGFSFNTSVSSFMICVNELTELKCNKKAVLQDLLICLSPYAPHITEELWEALGNQTSIINATYPTFKAEYLVEDSFSYPISINGKHRTNIEFSLSATQAEIEEAVLADETVQKWLEGKAPKKIIFVKGKIVNMVV